MSIKAYQVRTDDSEASVIAFAVNPASAKRMAHGTDWLANEDWTDLRATRLKEADQLHEGKEEVLDGSGPRSAFVMWMVGWHELEYSHEECGQCGRYQWEAIPESTLTEKEADVFICQQCESQPATPQRKPTQRRAG